MSKDGTVKFYYQYKRFKLWGLAWEYAAGTGTYHKTKGEMDLRRERERERGYAYGVLAWMGLDRASERGGYRPSERVRACTPPRRSLRDHKRTTRGSDRVLPGL